MAENFSKTRALLLYFFMA